MIDNQGKKKIIYPQCLERWTGSFGSGSKSMYCFFNLDFNYDLPLSTARLVANGVLIKTDVGTILIGFVTEVGLRVKFLYHSDERFFLRSY